MYNYIVHRENLEIGVDLYTLPEVEIYKDSRDDIQIPRDTRPIVAKACPNSYTKFCCCSGKFCQSVRLCKSQNDGKVRKVNKNSQNM